jgi:NADH:ubiquinone oxidoreductase subunit 4 (subunit M)
LLKLGGYGLLRFVLSIGAESLVGIKPLINSLCVVSIIYTSLMALRQVDIKRIIAYSSIAHMNNAVLGIFTLNIYG